MRPVALPRFVAPLLLIGGILLVASCNQRRDIGPVVVSAIGPGPVLTDPARGALSGPARLLLDSTAQGLVRFDAVGQIAPGLAERWIVIDNGMSYIFRLREAEWSDGSRVTAAQIVERLRRQIAPRSRNPLRPYLTAVDEIVEMTPQVIEVRLKRPRPDLLKLFAQPELALLLDRPPRGTGPFRVAPSGKNGTLLTPAFDPARATSDDVEEPGPEQSVQLIGERSARAIVRFAERQSDLVSGGTFVDWPLLKFVEIAPANFRLDPAEGLFGFAIVNREGFLADADNRAALSQVIDRIAIVSAFAPGWQATEQILPAALDSAANPSIASWATLSPAQRREGARARVRRWKASHDRTITIRIALPSGPGATILYGFVGAALRSIGLTPQRVNRDAPADLRLIDSVAPYDSARWYLATACQPCGEDVEGALNAARDADSLSERAQRIAEADALVNEDAAFIPIARPLRWSLVALRLSRWQGNGRAWHPLNELRTNTR
ncbi:MULTISPECIES: ABC transporter substrate-binding protein [unclassified Sphingomonas]|uniref:ABC transporter substrate-binding protein n=1 Tax=unclassified Sphingomonas TaxID=196159 RepID=UPI000BD5994E|nr:MAG: ABC transporter substrate-binding protein [Sphingomonas sp. 12-62-6]OYX37393.1 MAG: ABC transporter substrate-binding protein [Sphingomonas sp. 32-62-10]